MDAGRVFQGLEQAAVEVLGSEFEMLLRQSRTGAQGDIPVCAWQGVSYTCPLAVGWRVCGVGHGLPLLCFMLVVPQQRDLRACGRSCFGTVYRAFPALLSRML